MYKVEKTEYGFRLTVGATFSEEDMIRFQADIRSIRLELPETFCGFVDARKKIAFDAETKMALKKMEQSIQQMGCTRFAVILKSPVVTSQLKQVAFESGTFDAERYIDATKYDNWEQLGLDWIIDGIEPAENRRNVENLSRSK